MCSVVIVVVVINDTYKLMIFINYPGIVVLCWVVTAPRPSQWKIQRLYECVYTQTYEYVFSEYNLCI